MGGLDPGLDPAIQPARVHARKKSRWRVRAASESFAKTAIPTNAVYHGRIVQLRSRMKSEITALAS